MPRLRHTVVQALALGVLLAVPRLAAANPADRWSAAGVGPSCVQVKAAFSTGSYDDREAIVDALQDVLKADATGRTLGRDEKVQAIMMTTLHCIEHEHDVFLPVFDQTIIQVKHDRPPH